MTLTQLALLDLWRRPARSALTVVAIAIGIAAIVSLTSIAWGFEASWQRANDARGTDLIVTRRASENALPAAFRADAVQARLLAMPEVDQVAGLLSELLGVDEAPPMFVFGWAQGSFLWDHLVLRDGRWPRDDEEPAVVLGALAAELLHKQAGNDLVIEGTRFRVVGIFQSTALVENGAVLMSLAQAQRLNDKPGKVNILNVKLKPGAGEAGAARVRDAVKSSLPGYSAITSGQLVQQNALVRITKAMSAATILVAGLVGALGVFNTMLMSVSERTRAIGVLLAIGWRRGRVIRLVLIESAALSVLGGLLGVLLGVLGVTVLEHHAMLRGKIDGLFTGGLFASALGLALGLGLLGGLYPAWRASRLVPAAALRHE
ncbi:MAG: ABC transporter permease [Rubrivivax sp.]|nr:ABC transporter permease [Rubrivivax sp.]